MFSFIVLSDFPENIKVKYNNININKILTKATIAYQR